MGVSAVEKKDAGSAAELYESMEKKMGKVLNFFRVMAHKPDVLTKFLPFYQEVWARGEVPNKLKELAYLRTSILNGCEY
ncbi:MAG: carboxymuconolactone decarboxylase family protein [Deltaproteobacteria bacterium]|nr:carboxymuconolactone decarboxylase family protein [Deltaproteobacteria bacterium]